MKAISLWQPWATLIAHELKNFETRSWATGYRGRIAIHAAKRKPQPEELNDAINEALMDVGYMHLNELPLGAVVAIATLADVHSTSKGPRRLKWDTPWLQEIREKETQFGDFSPGRYAWRLTNVRWIQPIPARGAQGLWDWQPPTHLDE